MRAFVAMCKFIASNAEVFQHMSAVEKKQIKHRAETVRERPAEVVSE